jgi:uncharacterized protein (TIGR01777 family)
MEPERFVRRVRLPVPAREAFAWHARPGAFERLSPPWDRVEVLERRGGIEDGGRVVLRVGPLGIRWEIEHRDHVEGVQFRDVQRRGPFARWDHLHRFEPAGPDACTLEDRIEWALPFGVAGRLLGRGTVRATLERLFAYRHAVTAADLAMHAAAREAGPQRVLISGGRGLLGAALRPMLSTGGHAVRTLTRAAPRDGSESRWDPARGVLDPAAFEGLDAVVHLAGASIGARWTAERRRAIRESRVGGMGLIAERIAASARPPRVLVSASAVGYYGDRGDQVLTEESAPGSGFLPELTRAWESATAPAEARGVRVVHLRFGVVLTPRGGALARMTLPFRLGLGGPLGGGRQWMSWIAVDDACALVHRAILDPALSGAVNAVAPEPVTARTFARTLGAVLGRPALVPVPALALRLAFGEMADGALLASLRVTPARLEHAGHRFRHATLADALRHVLGRRG